MTKYTMAVQMSGTRNGADWPPVGETVDLPESEAARYLAARLIVPVAPVVEAAVAPPVEKAIVPTAPRGLTKAKGV